MICPSCGHQHSQDPKIELKLFIKLYQPMLGKLPNIKQKICKQFQFRRFDDIPIELYPAVLEYAEREVNDILIFRVIYSSVVSYLTAQYNVECRSLWISTTSIGQIQELLPDYIWLQKSSDQVREIIKDNEYLLEWEER